MVLPSRLIRHLKKYSELVISLTEKWDVKSRVASETSAKTWNETLIVPF